MATNATLFEKVSSTFLAVFFVIIGLPLGVSIFYGDYMEFAEIYNQHIANGDPGWSGQNSLYGQLALLFLAISIVAFLSISLFLLLEEERKAGYAAVFGFATYGIYEIVMSAAINSLEFSIKSLTTAGVFFIISSILIFVSVWKSDIDKAPLLYFVSLLVVLLTWWYHGYRVYTAVDPGNYYGIFWLSTLKALGESFGVFPFALMGGIAAPVILIGLMAMSILAYRAGDVTDSLFGSIIGFFLVISYIIGASVTIVGNINYFESALNYINPDLDFAALYSIFSVFFGIMFLAFLFIGTYSLYDYLTSAPAVYREKAVKPKPVGVIVKAEKPEEEELEEAIEEIDIDDLDLVR